MRLTVLRPQCLTCPRLRRAGQLMCNECWRLVPVGIRRRIWRATRPGTLPQSPDWSAAVDDAAAAVRAARTTPAEVRRARIVTDASKGGR